MTEPQKQEDCGARKGLISVVTVNYNGARHLYDCLSSLQDQKYPDVEIIVVDNGSQDDSREICAEYGVEFVESGGNIGLGAAYNAGARRARGDYLFLTNNDMRFERNCLSELVAAIERAGPDCFAADPLQYNWEATEIIHYRCMLRPLDRPIEVFSNLFSLLPPLQRVYGRIEENTLIPFASGGSMLVRRKLFDALGGFDPMFFLDWEDVDLCWRANRCGWHCVFVPSARLYHKWGGTIQQVEPGLSRHQLRMMVSQQYNQMRFALKNYDLANALLIVLCRFGGAPLYLLRRKPGVALGGLLGGLKVVRTLPSIVRERRRLQASAVISNGKLFALFRQDAEPHRLVWPASLAPKSGGAGETESRRRQAGAGGG